MAAVSCGYAQAEAHGPAYRRVVDLQYVMHGQIYYKLHNVAEGSADHVPEVLWWLYPAEVDGVGEARGVRIRIEYDVIDSADARSAHALELLDFVYEQCGG
mmetsp:Transcript_18538/g.28831  ORF Transcript_18538/g.28831 Transcript_18538/m.28831 type:complete len:101 (-) Transcript_18538:4-306(-)|eukprot:CAMPEP_0196807858 /NCGR_PEP_ID=MMETSP1362-20130617/7848_1 /TAXON_ID=163516 /ORGANISM="Leptocylindrus danicus, Strain CCMP1856" /LENGTH=100 /DNA_ID=CAMNT_0042181949 /DNA_START=603 /DNA_END=905 /DNA_ORIENTATION=-